MIRTVLLLLALVACSSTTPRGTITRPRIVAHRGAQLAAPENTVAAFRDAWALGVEGVELDARVTSDGHVIVLHDGTTQRLTGVDYAVHEHTLAELQALDLRGHRIPTLAEVLAGIPQGGALFLELKSDTTTVPTVAAVVAKHRPAHATILLQSFDADVLARLGAAIPNAPMYWTVDPPVTEDRRQILPYPTTILDEAKRRGFAGLALDYRATTDELIAAATAAGILVDVWTINTAAELATWTAKPGVRWIETDHPDLVPATR